MRQWIAIVILAAGFIGTPQGSWAQEASQEPSPPPAQTQPGGMSKFFRAIAPDSLDIGVTKCADCEKSQVNGGALMGMGWELPTPSPLKKKGLVFAAGLALITEEPGDKEGSSSANKEGNLQGGGTLGLQCRLMKFISIKGGVAYGGRTWGFVAFSMNYNESGSKPPEKTPDKAGK
jgi:hypothetical protein